MTDLAKQPAPRTSSLFLFFCLFVVLTNLWFIVHLIQIGSKEGPPLFENSPFGLFGAHPKMFDAYYQLQSIFLWSYVIVAFIIAITRKDKPNSRSFIPESKLQMLPYWLVFIGGIVVNRMAYMIAELIIARM